MTRENVNTEVREDRGKEKISENEIFVQKMSEIVIKERVVREKRERTSTSSSISSSRAIIARARVGCKTRDGVYSVRPRSEDTFQLFFSNLRL
jgi:hypothetical protein